MNYFRGWLATTRTISRNLRGARLEPEVPYLQYVLRPGDNCLHIGASDGRHSYVMSDLVKPGQIYALEPSAYSFAILRRAIAFHGLSNVHPFHAAVSDEDGFITLTAPIKANKHVGRAFAVIAETASGSGALRSDVRGSGTFTERVESVAIDHFCPRHGIKKVDFIRCDVEGAEMKVLKGAQNTIDRDLPSFLIEIHPVALSQHFNSSAEAVRDEFLRRGYRMFGIEDGEMRETTTLRPEAWADYYFIHPSRRDALPEGLFRKALQNG